MTYVKVDNPDRPTTVLETDIPREHVDDDGIRHPFRRWVQLGHDADLRKFGWVPALLNRPNFDPATQRLDGPEFVVVGGRATERYTVRQATAEELAAATESKREEEYSNQVGSTLGPVLDAVIAKIRALEAANTAAPQAEFDTIVSRIDAIKAANR